MVITLCFSAAAIAGGAANPQRLGTKGAIIHNAFGLPKWRTSHSVDNTTEAGDTLLLTMHVNANERLTVGAYLYATPLRKEGNQWIVNGNEQPVQPNALGTEWGYRSQTFTTAGAWAMIDNWESKAIDIPVQVFVPYGIMQLPRGPYRFRYKLRVFERTSGQLIDEYFVKHTYDGEIADGYIREVVSVCRACGGVPIEEFTLEGLTEESPQPAN